MVSFQAKLTRWESLSTNLTGRLPALPELEPHHNMFKQIIADGLALVAQQDAAKATLQTTTEKRLDLERRGDHLREYLVATLRREFGVDSKQLVEFGVRPRPIGKRKARASAKPAPVTPAATKAGEPKAAAPAEG